MDKQKNSLVVLWTSGDRDVAMKMVFMYTLNAKIHEWWDEVTLIVWGPSAKLASEDEDIQASIEEMKQAGVILEACKGCSDQYGVSDALRNMGIHVRYMGIPLSDYLKEEGKAVLAL